MWILVSCKSVDRYGVVWVQKGASLVVVFSSRIIQSENLTSKTVYLFSCKVYLATLLTKTTNTILSLVDYQETDSESLDLYFTDLV